MCLDHIFRLDPSSGEAFEPRGNGPCPVRHRKTSMKISRPSSLAKVTPIATHIRVSAGTTLPPLDFAGGRTAGFDAVPCQALRGTAAGKGGGTAACDSQDVEPALGGRGGGDAAAGGGPGTAMITSQLGHGAVSPICSGVPIRCWPQCGQLKRKLSGVGSSDMASEGTARE